MSRPQVAIRRVDPGLYQDLIDLWVTYRGESGASAEGTHRIATDGSLPACLERPEVTAFLAVAEGRPIGYVILSETTAGLFADSPCVSIDQLYVDSRFRRHGAARQLLAAVTTHADRVGAEQIASHVPSQVRDANRFFARLGFTPTVVRRVTTPSALRRKLVGSESRSSINSLNSWDEVLLRRRSARIRAVRQSRPSVRGA